MATLFYFLTCKYLISLIKTLLFILQLNLKPLLVLRKYFPGLLKDIAIFGKNMAALSYFLTSKCLISLIKAQLLILYLNLKPLLVSKNYFTGFLKNVAIFKRNMATLFNF